MKGGENAECEKEAEESRRGSAIAKERNRFELLIPFTSRAHTRRVLLRIASL